jgi:hypothetical protein
MENNCQAQQAVSICVVNKRSYSLDILRANLQNNDGLSFGKLCSPAFIESRAQYSGQQNQFRHGTQTY